MKIRLHRRSVRFHGDIHQQAQRIIGVEGEAHGGFRCLADDMPQAAAPDDVLPSGVRLSRFKMY